MTGLVAAASLLWSVSTPADVYAIDVFGALREPGQAAAIIGHRGDRAQAPENTMPSLESAMDELEYVETDVRLTRDGVPVLFHDTDLERVTGRTGRVEDLDHDQVARLDAGAWYAEEWAGEPIPTLEEFLAALGERDAARALVELKADWTASEVRIVLDLIERHGLRGRIILQSFSIETLQSIQRVAPTTPRIMLIRELPADPVPLADELGVIGFGTTAASVTDAPGAVDAAHAAGLAVLCYTLNTQDRWQEVSALGVDGIITDQPSDLDAWIASTAPGT
ncbi:Glycerophosphodiester phosphodiesterase, cytoplasmic [Agromyces marinus]|uniref:Glycerophosphodiester phosphodiesterase n=2 Tax=Agromyces marinus TaxID=1389020 RepID=A0ABM8GYG5_9MICO|nr:glycerophosphodiester phosphodiesterase family protein [Agromyces marinus]UIP58224.1 Glycerophosphodiester phosphodiesterase, cytoplasmic [Agromyces marinus]BDZ53534.1 glycerophosphodiester phosphodiesterase [Agromyces marinus]